MQFLHLLLPLGLVFLVDSGWIGRINPHPQLGDVLDDNKDLPNEPERRNSRLARTVDLKLTDEEKKKFDELAAKMVELKPENQEKNDDLFEVNMKKGITDLFEGDIELSQYQLEEMGQSSEGGRRKRQADGDDVRWLNNIVYYFFAPTINQAKKNAFLEATDFLSRRTCLKFVQSATAQNRIRVTTGKGCSSMIGMAGGQQDLSLDDGCEPVGTVIHEIMHALGIVHMQQRYDRDKYVLLDISAAKEDHEDNFNKLMPYDTFDSTPYEYGSVMHYSATTFTANGKPVIIPLDSRYSVTMGSKIVSFYDLKMINDYYQCSAAPLNCQNGGFPNPFIPGRCICPAGYGHLLCDVRPYACGEELNATANWQTTQLTPGTPNDASTVLAYRYCYHWITAPKGKKVQVKLTAMEKNTCNNGCTLNGIEPKVLPNPEVTNPRYCCPAQLKGEVLTSELNPMPVVAYNLNHYSKFTFQYRFVDGGPSPATTTPKPTVALKPEMECIDTQADCEQRKREGQCNVQEYGLRYVKMTCAVTCGVCDKKPYPCFDRQKEECATFDCNKMGPMFSEYYCAETCGFCGPVYPKLIVTPSTTTSKPTTTTPWPACYDTQSEADCAGRKAEGFCQQKDLAFVKFACAETCNLCDWHNDACFDFDGPECKNFDCEGNGPMNAEFLCAKTCGLCKPDALKTTVTSTGTTPTVSRCHDTLADCAARKILGFCDDFKKYPFNFVKASCAVTCGICDIPPTPCVDLDQKMCLNYDCKGNDPMTAEYYCAKTCGFCKEPDSTTVSTTPLVTKTGSKTVSTTTLTSQDCYDTQNDCDEKKSRGFCEMKQQPFNVVKMACAATCGVCGIPHSSCEDLNKEECVGYDCNGTDAYFAEFECAKTCGFCGNPAPNAPPPTPTAPLGKRDCHDTQPDCAARKANGICEMKQQPFNVVKMACAETCNLCGKAPSPCKDMLNQCATFECSKEDPMIAEFNCAKTCGFCDKPN